MPDDGLQTTLLRRRFAHAYLLEELADKVQVGLRCVAMHAVWLTPVEAMT